MSRRHSRPSADAVRSAADVTQVGIRELARNVSAVVAEVTRTGVPAVVTKHGQPVVAVVPIDSADLDARALVERASGYVADLGEDERADHGPSARFADQLARLAEALRLQDPQAQRVP